MTKVYNPILTGFHADPSILAVNGEFFIANSTFEWYPGVELHRSKDLVHWTCVPSPLSEDRHLNMTGVVESGGIWAPCLSFSDNRFWLIFTDVKNWNKGPWKDTPNYLVTADSIEGPWSDPVFLNASGFDPSMFHDDDGRHWLVNMEWDYRKTGPRQFSGILIQEYSPSKKHLIGKPRKIYTGTDIGCIEGPHLYKRNGWYYLMAAEGGTGYEHAISVARSRNLFGPYETHPQNPLISSYRHPELAIQKAGHGNWVEAADGNTYLVYLCGRPLPGTKKCTLGRETSIAKMIWKDDWPYVIQPDGSLQNTPPEYVEIPADVELLAGEKDRNLVGGKSDDYCRVTRYDFIKKDFLADFKALRYSLFSKKHRQRFSLDARPGFLRIYGGQSFVSNFDKALIARRQTDFVFEAETKIYYEPSSFQHLAGLTYRYDEDTQYNLCVTYDEELGKVLQFQAFMASEAVTPKPAVCGEYFEGLKIKLQENQPVWLKLTVNYRDAYFSYSEDGKSWKKLFAKMDASFVSDEHGGLGFTGAFVGMFAIDMADYSKYADFEYFTYTKDK
ncbi:MAG: glycoside hydrolase family 43 protein [Treponema sp.]|nr:glycoside hydrolase family 43 protein [Treponema sp.]